MRPPSTSAQSLRLVTNAGKRRRVARSWIDEPRPTYFGPLMIGKAVGRKPDPTGRHWIGNRIAP